MRIRTTVILAAISIVLAIYTVVSERRPETGRSAASNANVLVRFDPESIKQVVIEQGDQKTMIEDLGGVWFFKEPVVDRVDKEVMVSLFDQLNHLSIVDVIDEGEAGQSRSELGLKGKDAIRVTLMGQTKDEKEVKETVILGMSAPREGAIYASLTKGKQISVVDGNPREWLMDPLEKMRDRRVLSVPVEAIVQLGIGRSTGEVVLQRRLTPPQQDWSIAAPIQARADLEKVDELFADLSALKIDEVVSEVQVSEPIPNPLPERAALFQVRVYGLEQPVTIYLKEVEPAPVEGAPARVEVKLSDRPGVYRFNSRILETLPTESNDLRDRTLARIPMSYLTSITIESRIDPPVFLQSERVGDRMAWDVLINRRYHPANPNQVGELINGVNEAAVITFADDEVKDLADYGLMPPAQAIRFDFEFPGTPDEEGNPGPPQRVNRELHLGWKQGENSRLFANFKGDSHVVELDPTFASLIPTHPVKWRSLSVLNFNQFHLKSITRQKPGVENLKLEYDQRYDRWKGYRSGVDITATLDHSNANLLRNRLGSLTANGWFLSLGAAFEALKHPSLTFEIVKTEFDPAVGEGRDVTYTIRFAPSKGGVYYGMVENSKEDVGVPDVFYINRETYRDLIAPITTSRGSK